jgi:molybdopterin-guanine dinucleotide biosynthesis protein A
MTAGAILAGGRARRYGGADKSRLVVEGESIIARQIAALRPITQTIFVVVDSETRGADFADVGLAFEIDRLPGRGALGGIYTALASARAESVITIACDLPFLTSDLLARLVERSHSADAAWVRTAKGPEPLIACYQRAAADAVRRQIEQGRLKVADLAQVLTIVEMGLEEIETFGPARRLLANINTPDELTWIVGGHTPQDAPIVSHGTRPSGRRGEAG